MLWKINGYGYQVKVIDEPDSIELEFRYDKTLVETVKSNFEKAKYQDSRGRKYWTMPRSDRNLYRIEKLSGTTTRYDDPTIPDINCKRKLYIHQKKLVGFGFVKNRCIWAGDMGIGKTLAGIELMELTQLPWLIVCPKTAIPVWNGEMKKWSANIPHRLISYGKLEWWFENGPDEYYNVFYDEAHALANPDTKRTLAAMGLSKKYIGYIIMATGTPAPKNTLNWWSLCEICQPGFLEWPNIYKMRDYLAVTETNVGMAGQQFKTIKEWRPDKLKELTKKLDGIRIPILKKDCLDLPEKIYQEIELPYGDKEKSIVRAILVSKGRGIQGLIKLRQYSDGFNYKGLCNTCNGTGTNKGTRGFCHTCDGSGETTTEFPTPKDDALIERFLENEELERLVVYAAFRNSIDKCIKFGRERDWEIIRVDGRGISGDIEQFQSDSERKILFVGHPESGGQGFTLNKSEHIVYYSNDFNSKNRWQSEDRIHRIGTTRAVITDLLWIPTDKFILNNLKLKRDLLDVTLNDLEEFVNHEYQVLSA